MRASVLFMSCMFLFLIGCSDGGNESTDEDKLYSASFSGKAEKGPYESGTVVTIQELDGQLRQTGQSYTTTITSDLGEYSFFGEVNTQYLEVFADGFYFDEVQGSSSNSQLQINAVLDAEKTDSANLNILSSLASKRIKELLDSDGMSFEEAEQKAQNELLEAFNINVTLDGSFKDAELSSSGEKGKVLAAISSILMQVAHKTADNNDSVTSALSIFITNFKEDFSRTGTIDDSSIKQKITDASMNVDVANVERNLNDRFLYNVSNIDDYIDRDGDGIVKIDDDNEPDSVSIPDISGLDYQESFQAGSFEITGIPEDSHIRLTVSDGLTIEVNDQIVDGQEVMVINGDIVKISGSSGGFGVTDTYNVDIGDLEKEFNVNTKSINTKPFSRLGSLDFKNGKIYVLDRDVGLLIYEYSDSSGMSFLSQYNETGPLNGVVATTSGSQVYFTHSFSGLFAIDSSDITNLRLIENIDERRKYFSLDGENLIYTYPETSNGEGPYLKFSSIQSDGSLTLDKELKAEEWPLDTSVKNEDVAVANASYGVVFYSLSSYSKQGRYQGSSNAERVNFNNGSEDLLLVSEGREGMKLLDTSSYSSPNLLLDLDKSVENAIFSKNDDYILVGAREGLFIYNIREKTNIELTRVYDSDGFGSVKDLALNDAGDRLAVSMNDDSVRVLELESKMYD